MSLEKSALIIDTREGKVLASRVSKYSKAVALLDTEVNLLACSILNHVIEHGEVSLANKLLNGMGKSQRKNALLRWFIDFGPMNLAPAVDKAKGAQNVVYAKGKTTHKGLDAALEVPFWEYTQEEAVKDFDIMKSYYASVNSLIKKAKAKIEEVAMGSLDASKVKVDQKFLAKLEAEAASFVK